MKILLPKDPRERKPLLFTFDGDLEPGEAITLISVAIEVAKGTDAAASAVLDVAPVLLTQSRQVLQWVSGGVLGVDYGISCLVTGSNGGQHLATCRLPVRKL